MSREVDDAMATREFMLGDPLLTALRPSPTKSEAKRDCRGANAVFLTYTLGTNKQASDVFPWLGTGQ